MKVIGFIIGAVVGAMGSYVFRPVTFFGTPTFAQWFEPEAIKQMSGSTIAICGVVGSLIGLALGTLIDNSKKSTNQKPNEAI